MSDNPVHEVLTKRVLDLEKQLNDEHRKAAIAVATEKCDLLAAQQRKIEKLEAKLTEVEAARDAARRQAADLGVKRDRLQNLTHGPTGILWRDTALKRLEVISRLQNERGRLATALKYAAPCYIGNPPKGPQWSIDQQEFVKHVLEDTLAGTPAGESSNQQLADCVEAGWIAGTPAPVDAIAAYIDDHGTTCDGCQHVLIDVTAAQNPKEKSHVVAGDPEGEGSGCAYCKDFDARLHESKPAPATQCRCPECNCVFSIGGPVGNWGNHSHECSQPLPVQLELFAPATFADGYKAGLEDVVKAVKDVRIGYFIKDDVIKAIRALPVKEETTVFADGYRAGLEDAAAACKQEGTAMYHQEYDIRPYENCERAIRALPVKEGSDA